SPVEGSEEENSNSWRRPVNPAPDTGRRGCTRRDAGRSGYCRCIPLALRRRANDLCTRERSPATPSMTSGPLPPLGVWLPGRPWQIGHTRGNYLLLPSVTVAPHGLVAMLIDFIALREDDTEAMYFLRYMALVTLVACVALAGAGSSRSRDGVQD